MNARQQLAKAFKAAVFDRIEWRPVSDQPEEGHVSLVRGTTPHLAAGIFKGGEWKNAKGNPLSFAPTHWLALL